MTRAGTLAHCDAALRLIGEIADPVTRTLVNMAFVHFVKKAHVERVDPPDSDLDMLYVVACLRDFFAEHDVLARTLAGERVGAWFEDGAGSGTRGENGDE